MIIVLRPDATDEQIAHLKEKLEALGLAVHVSKGKERTVLGAIGDERVLMEQPIGAFPGVEKVVPILKPYKLASREFHADNTIININGAAIGDKKIQLIAGPCAVENREMLIGIAKEIKDEGGMFIRGGAFKPRTSPYTFQGLGLEGLKYLAEARDKTGLRVVTELMDPRDLEMVNEYADVIQIGARNMQNFRLLQEVGNYDKPVIVDPSHGVGKWGLVAPMARAAVAAGADGILVEIHPNPENALSDGEQSLKISVFKEMMRQLRLIAQAVGREI